MLPPVPCRAPTKAKPKGLTHLCPSPFYQTPASFFSLQRHQHKYPQLSKTLHFANRRKTYPSLVFNPRTHTSTFDTHTARRYSSKRSLNTSSTLSQNPFPKVTPVPPSLCPSKISRPTVSPYAVTCWILPPLSLGPLFARANRFDSWIWNRRVLSSCTCICCCQATCQIPTELPHLQPPRSSFTSMTTNPWLNRPLRRSRRGHRRNQADAELHPYTHSA